MVAAWEQKCEPMTCVRAGGSKRASRGRLLPARQAEQVDKVLMKFEPDGVIGVAVRRGEIAMIAGLEPMQGLQPHLEAVDRLESDGDVIYRHALRRIYSEEFKARTSLFWKDVVEAMERA